MTAAFVLAALAALVCAVGWWRAHRRWKEGLQATAPAAAAPEAGELVLPSQVSALKPWEVVEFEHFVGIRHANGAWTHVILKPTGETLDIEAAGKRIQLHGNGIEFLPSESTQASILPLRPRGPGGEPEGGA